MVSKLLLGILDFINLAVILAFWDYTSSPLMDMGWEHELVGYGRLFGLLATFLILKQFLYIGRVKWIESLYGFERLVVAHKLNGPLIYVLVVLHILLVTAGHLLLSNRSLGQQLTEFALQFEYVAEAMLAMTVITVVYFITLFRHRINYQGWYRSHLLMYTVIPLVLAHQLKVGADLSSNPKFAAYWLALIMFVLVNFLFFRVLSPFVKFFRHDFYIDRIVEENEEVTSIYIKGRSLDRFRVKAGQFVIVRFLSKNLWKEAHPFSISCKPNSQFVRITVKAVGDFTKKLRNMEEGTKVMLDGPHGAFVTRRSKRNDVLLIAGGIGITPLCSIAEQLLDKKKRVTLIYCHRYEKDAVLVGELDALGETQGLNIHHVISRGDATLGERGRLTKDRLRRFVPNVEKHDVFICGPKQMMEDCIRILRGMRVPRNRIFFERFSY